MKPEAPSEYRGPFDPIATAVPGMDIVLPIALLMPLLVAQAMPLPIPLHMPATPWGGWGSTGASGGSEVGSDPGIICGA